jgi:hypothetical protein
MSQYQGVFVSDGQGNQFPFPPFITQREIDIIANEFVVLNDDVFVATYPRAGTTWTEQIVHLLVNHGEQGDQVLTEAVLWLETTPNRVEDFAAFQKVTDRRRLFTSHLPYALMPDLGGTDAKCVYVARNPKDVAVSYYYHDKSKGGYEGTWEEHFNLFLQGKVMFGSYFDHVLPWWEASQRQRENILFLKYEDMKRDLTATVTRIAEFIGVAADQKLVERVVAGSGFEAMATHTGTNFDWVPQREGVPKHYRKGMVGDWRNHFSEAQNQQLDALYRQKMTGTGLRFDFGDGLILP